MASNEVNPLEGDRVIKHIGPELGAFVADSAELSELQMTPFVNATALDIDSLDPETRHSILDSIAAADEAWAAYYADIEQERIASGLTTEEWEKQRSRKVIENMKKFLSFE